MPESNSPLFLCHLYVASKFLLTASKYYSTEIETTQNKCILFLKKHSIYPPMRHSAPQQIDAESQTMQWSPLFARSSAAAETC